MLDKKSKCYTRKSAKDGLYNTIERDSARFRELGFKEDDIIYDIQSGDDDDRPGFEKIIGLVREKNISLLVITRVDRLGRRGSSLLELYRTMGDNKIGLYLDEQSRILDLSNPYDWSLVADGAVRSEYERRMNILRINRGFEYKKKQGKTAGGRAPYGYEKSKKQDIYLPPENKPLVRKIVEITLEEKYLSRAVSRIFTELDIKWSPSQLRGWMHQACLRGHVGWKTDLDIFDLSDSPVYTRMFYNANPNNRVLSEEEYENFKNNLKENRDRWGANVVRQPYPLSGLCYCLHCGERLCYSKNYFLGKNNEKVYMTKLRHIHDVHKIRSDECRHTFNALEIEKTIDSRLQENAENIINAVILPTAQEESANPELISLKSKLNLLKSLNDPLLDPAIKSVEQQISKFTKKENNSAIFEEELRYYAKLFANPEFITSIPSEEKRIWYKKLIKSVKIGLQDGEITCLIDSIL